MKSTRGSVKKVDGFPEVQRCMECGKRAWGGRLGSWLVADDFWAAAGYKPTDVACAGCFSKRLRKAAGLTARSLTEMLREFRNLTDEIQESATINRAGVFVHQTQPEHARHWDALRRHEARQAAAKKREREEKRAQKASAGATTASAGATT